MNDISDVLYVIAAVLVFGLFANTINRSMVNTTEMTVESEVEYFGISMAQSIIEEARVRSFDKNTVSTSNRLVDPSVIASGSIPSGFTATDSLGADAGEVYPEFDDFDDYDGLNITRTSGYGTYTMTATVFYVAAGSPTVNAGTKTSLKRLEVTVTHADMRASVTLSYVKTYY
jgi:hypothetical protein